MTALALAVAVWAWGMAHRPPRRTPAPSSAVDTPHRRRHAENIDWARFLDAVAARVRGGTHLRIAFAEAQRELPHTASALGPHHRFDDLERLSPSDPDEAVVVQVVTAASRWGGSTAATVQSGASMLRERAAARHEAAAHSAQARLSARVLTLVPLVFATWSFAASAAFRHAVGTTAGLVAITTGLVCNLLGWWWMRHIVRSATP
jgi:tight adherence protein B